MKSIILAYMLLSGTSVLAADYRDLMTVSSATRTCGQLQSLLNLRGGLYVTSRWSAGAYFAEPASCTGDTRANVAYVRSSDQTFCRLGFVCESISQGQ